MRQSHLSLPYSGLLLRRASLGWELAQRRDLCSFLPVCPGPAKCLGTKAALDNSQEETPQCIITIKGLSWWWGRSHWSCSGKLDNFSPWEPPLELDLKTEQQPSQWGKVVGDTLIEKECGYVGNDRWVEGQKQEMSWGRNGKIRLWRILDFTLKAKECPWEVLSRREKCS